MLKNKEHGFVRYICLDDGTVIDTLQENESELRKYGLQEKDIKDVMRYKLNTEG